MYLCKLYIIIDLLCQLILFCVIQKHSEDGNNALVRGGGRVTMHIFLEAGVSIGCVSMLKKKKTSKNYLQKEPAAGPHRQQSFLEFIACYITLCGESFKKRRVTYVSQRVQKPMQP